MIKFEPTFTLGRGKHIRVLSTSRGPIGWIAEGQDKVYRYYEPYYSKELNPTYSIPISKPWKTSLDTGGHETLS